jgi:PAS domain S-box-containing protein
MAAARHKRISRWVVGYGLKPCAIALCFVLVALLWTFPLQRVIAYPFVFLFFAAIMGSAWFGGAVAGFMAVVLSSVFITYFFIPPFYSITVAKGSQSFLAAFILSAIAIAIVSSARKRAESLVRIARDQLEVRVQERTAELVRSNLEIQESVRQLRMLTEAIPQQIWQADTAGRIEYCNQNLLDYVGASGTSLCGEPLLEFLHEEDAPLFRREWEAALAAGAAFETEARVRGADRRYRWFLIRGIPHRFDDGQIARWYGIHIDIEERRGSQQLLFSAQSDLSRFSRSISLAEMAASIAHELNQPLTALVTYASACRRWLQAEPANLSRARGAAERIIEETERAGNVVRRVRSLFSKTDYVRESADLNGIIVDLVRVLRDDAIRRSVSIQLHLADDLPLLKIDAIQIQQVLLNLAINGMEAMSEMDGARLLEIYTGLVEPDQILVTVKDYGPGFEERLRIRIFDPFFTTKPGGTGMGLAICRSIIEEHGGRIWAGKAESGTVFQFLLKVNG